MPTLTVDCDFDVFCAGCGAGLCNQTDVDDRKKRLSIEPCDRCLERAIDEAYDRGYEDGCDAE